VSGLKTGTMDRGVSISLSYSLMENLWLSFGCNFYGFQDPDLSQGGFITQGPLMKLCLKFDQQRLKDLILI
jgi:hypothetical protein